MTVDEDLVALNIISNTHLGNKKDSVLVIDHGLHNYIEYFSMNSSLLSLIIYPVNWTVLNIVQSSELLHAQLESTGCFPS